VGGVFGFLNEGLGVHCGVSGVLCEVMATQRNSWEIHGKSVGNERNPWEILGTLRKVTVFGGFNEIFKLRRISEYFNDFTIPMIFSGLALPFENQRVWVLDDRSSHLVLQLIINHADDILLQPSFFLMVYI
jgi:hypothetical protein